MAFQVSLQGCLHFQHLFTLTHFPWWGLTAPVSMYSSSQSTLPSAWGTRPSRNTYMKMQLKVFFFHWIVQAVFRDEGSKCSVKATQYGMDRGWGTEVGRSTPNAVSIEVAHLTYIIQALCFNSAVVIWWNTLTPKTQALFIAGLKQSVFCSMYQYNMQQVFSFFFFLCRWMRTCKDSPVNILQDLFELLVIVQWAKYLIAKLFLLRIICLLRILGRTFEPYLFQPVL